MMQNYMWELPKFDVVVSHIMRVTPRIVKPNFVNHGINSDGLILHEPWSVVIKINLNGVTKFNKMEMMEIYTIFPNNLTIMKQNVMLRKKTSEPDKKVVYDRITLYEALQNRITYFNNFMVEHQMK